GGAGGVGGSLVEVVLLDVRQQVVKDGAGVGTAAGEGAGHRRQVASVRVVEVVGGQADLLEVVLAPSAVGGLADLLDGGQEHGDDRYHHQQLDQREAQAGTGTVAHDENPSQNKRPWIR